MPHSARKHGSSLYTPQKKERTEFEQATFEANKRKRGISTEQVCVPCTVNYGGLSVADVAGLGNVDYAGIETVIGGCIRAMSIICRDSAQAYKRIASEHSCRRVSVKAHKHGSVTYGVQMVNTGRQAGLSEDDYTKALGYSSYLSLSIELRFLYSSSAICDSLHWSFSLRRVEDLWDEKAGGSPSLESL